MISIDTESHRSNLTDVKMTDLSHFALAAVVLRSFLEPEYSYSTPNSYFACFHRKLGVVTHHCIICVWIVIVGF